MQIYDGTPGRLDTEGRLWKATLYIPPRIKFNHDQLTEERPTRIKNMHLPVYSCMRGVPHGGSLRLETLYETFGVSSDANIMTDKRGPCATQQYQSSGI